MNKQQKINYPCDLCSYRSRTIFSTKRKTFILQQTMPNLRIAIDNHQIANRKAILSMPEEQRARARVIEHKDEADGNDDGDRNFPHQKLTTNSDPTTFFPNRPLRLQLIAEESENDHESIIQTFENHLELNEYVAESPASDPAYSLCSELRSFESAYGKSVDASLPLNGSLSPLICKNFGQNNSPDEIRGVTKKNVVEISVLGRGAGGVVTEAIHFPSLTVVAVKNVDSTDKSKRSQLIRELYVLRSIVSPHLIAYYGTIAGERNIKVILECMDRGSLQSIIDAYGALNERIVQHIGYCCCVGLRELHRNHRVHRDVKPHNILIDRKGNVKVGDFGLLSQLANTQAQCSTFVDTMIYMSPERLASESYSYSSDIWALGLVLATAATGKFPLSTSNGFFGLLMALKGDFMPKLPQHFSANFHNFLSRCLVTDPQARATIGELLAHPFLVSAPKTCEEVMFEWPEGFRDRLISNADDKRLPNPTEQSMEVTGVGKSSRLDSIAEALVDAYAESDMPMQSPQFSSSSVSPLSVNVGSSLLSPPFASTKVKLSEMLKHFSHSPISGTTVLMSPVSLVRTNTADSLKSEFGSNKHQGSPKSIQQRPSMCIHCAIHILANKLEIRVEELSMAVSKQLKTSTHSKASSIDCSLCSCNSSS